LTSLLIAAVCCGTARACLRVALGAVLQSCAPTLCVAPCRWLTLPFLLCSQLSELPADAQLEQYVKRGDWPKVLSFVASCLVPAVRHNSKTATVAACRALIVVAPILPGVRDHQQDGRERAQQIRLKYRFISVLLLPLPLRCFGPDLCFSAVSVVAVHAASLAKDNRHKEALFVFAK
jgi:hypothetical protein